MYAEVGRARVRDRARFWYALIGFHFLVGRKWVGLGLGLGLRLGFWYA